MSIFIKNARAMEMMMLPSIASHTSDDFKKDLVVNLSETIFFMRHLKLIQDSVKIIPVIPVEIDDQ